MLVTYGNHKVGLLPTSSCIFLIFFPTNIENSPSSTYRNNKKNMKSFFFSAHIILLEIFASYWASYLGATWQSFLTTSLILCTMQVSTYMSCVVGKHDLRFLSLSYPKKDRRAGPCQSFFGYDTDYKIVLGCLHRLYSLVSVIPKERLVRPGLPILAYPSFGMTTTKILRHVFPWHSSYINIIHFITFDFHLD